MCISNLIVLLVVKVGIKARAPSINLQIVLLQTINMASIVSKYFVDFYVIIACLLNIE